MCVQAHSPHTERAWPHWPLLLLGHLLQQQLPQLLSCSVPQVVVLVVTGVTVVTRFSAHRLRLRFRSLTQCVHPFSVPCLGQIGSRPQSVFTSLWSLFPSLSLFPSTLPHFHFLFANGSKRRQRREGKRGKQSELSVPTTTTITSISTSTSAIRRTTSILWMKQQMPLWVCVCVSVEFLRLSYCQFVVFSLSLSSFFTCCKQSFSSSFSALGTTESQAPLLSWFGQSA